MDPYGLLKQKKRCEKIIGISKYELSNTNSQQWWWRKFRIMEEFSSLPFYNRMKYLEKCFSKETLQACLNTGIKAYAEIDDGLEEFEKEVVLVPRPSKTEFAPKKPHVDEPLKRKQYSNPYLNFMRKTEEQACIWRPQRRPSIDKMHIVQKAKNIEELIAAEFDEWFRQVGSSPESEIDKDTIVSLFQLLFHFPAATSLIRNIIEVGSIPEHTANYLGFPQFADDRCVQRQLFRDIKAERLPKKEFAFSKSLPFELRTQALPGDLKSKWFEYQAQRQDLVNMAVVWRGITQLHSTNSFCYWLLAHPEVKPPQYLVDFGMMNKKFLDINATTIVGPEELDRLLASVCVETQVENPVPSKSQVNAPKMPDT